MLTAAWTELLPDLFCWRDACNVYLLRDGKRAVVIDYGTGAWRSHLGALGVETLEAVVLTHAHRDQVCGLYRHPDPEVAVYAPAEDVRWLQSDSLQAFWRTYQNQGCPASYAAPRLPLTNPITLVSADMEARVGAARLCAVATPGHTVGAMSYVVAWRGHHVAFCGDAAHAGGVLHEPYHLEWDHWTAGGCLAAWYGLERLGYCGFDALLPAHGPAVLQRGRACVAQVQRRLLRLIRAKGSVCAGEPNRWVDLEPAPGGAWQVLPHLYHFGANSFVLVSRAGEALVVDPQLPDIDHLAPLLQAIGQPRVTVGTASHYHADHSDGLGWLRERHGAQSWVHPWVAEPITHRDRLDVPWLPVASVPVDRLLPESGVVQWNEYALDCRAFPGQTRWHTAIATQVDGERVLFSGDNYQPPSRWNGTGGFCAYNGSRFAEGFARSARLVRELAPTLICNGHGCVYRYAASHFRRIERWSGAAEKAVRDLCPHDDWLRDYDCRAVRCEPFVNRLAPGASTVVRLLLTGYTATTAAAAVATWAPAGWQLTPQSACVAVLAGGTTAVDMRLTVPADAPVGRHLVAVDVEQDGHLAAEACVAIVEVA